MLDIWKKLEGQKKKKKKLLLKSHLYLWTFVSVAAL